VIVTPIPSLTLESSFFEGISESISICFLIVAAYYQSIGLFEVAHETPVATHLIAGFSLSQCPTLGTAIAQSGIATALSGVT